MRHIIIFGLIAILTLGLWFFFSLFYAEKAQKYPVTVGIQQGDDIWEIASKLEKQDIIRNRPLFVAYMMLKGYHDKIQAKEFTFESSMRLVDVAHFLTRSFLVPPEVKVTLLEGMRSDEMAEYLSGILLSPSNVSGEERPHPLWFKNEFLNIVTDRSSLYPSFDFLPEGKSLEGYLFPDTYNFFVDAPPFSIIEKMLQNFDRRISPALREEMKRLGKTLHEIITLASILEREVQSSEDKKKVADIFYRRIVAGMPLQADSTVNFVTKKSESSVSLDDTQTDSPYNTYKYAGLPPGPICNPGLKSIEAAVYPEVNPYWYFLTAEISDGSDFDGGNMTVIYSKTFEEHVANKHKYLK